VSRGSDCLEELLDGFRGILQCDCYSAYGTPAAAHPAITQDRFVPGELKASGGFLWAEFVQGTAWLAVLFLPGLIRFRFSSVAPTPMNIDAPRQDIQDWN
jgi:hypothetical protein